MKKIIIVGFLGFVLLGGANAQSYTNGIGVRVGPGEVGATFKHFFSERLAVEAFVLNRPAFGLNYSYFRLGGVLGYHFPIEAVEGLSWYVGGGLSMVAYAGGYRKNYANSAAVGIAPHALGGAEYKFAKLPLAVAVDWMPGFLIGGHFNGPFFDAGGLAARYTFGD